MAKDVGNSNKLFSWANGVDDEEYGNEIDQTKVTDAGNGEVDDDQEYGDEFEPTMADVDDEEYGDHEFDQTIGNGKKKLYWADVVDDDEEYGDEFDLSRLLPPRQIIDPKDKGKKVIIDDEFDLSPVLPPRQVIGPNEKGVKKVIEYKLNEAGNKIKVTTTYRVRKISTKVSKKAIERRSWAKFGDAVDQQNNSRLTLVSTEDVFLERPRRAGEVEELKAKTDALGLGKENRGGFLMVCRTCGKKGDHYTVKCPYKDLIVPNSEAPNNQDQRPSSSSKANGSGGGGTYVPPNQREGAKLSGADMKRRNDENSIRVSNLSEDAQESDLYELFSPFGHITRVYVAPDRQTGLNRGFAFISFANKEDAQKAIKKLDGYGYDSLILKVEWSQPRSK